MFVKRLTSLILLHLMIAGAAAGQGLTSEAVASLITCGPSQEQLYTAFGHSAIRIHDPAQGIDLIYNYGVFDFDQPNFYLNFARGNNNYMLAVYEFGPFANAYIYDDRFIHEQTLDLTASQKQALFDFLEWNAQPANRSYRYDYFYDNCSSRIRDALIHVLGDTLRFEGSYITERRSIRDLTDLYLTHQPWGDLGIDICLGLPMDKDATAFEHMFLPDYLESGFDNATLTDSTGSRPLVKDTQVIYRQRQAPASGIQLTEPIVVFGILLLSTLVISYNDWKRKKLSTWFDRLLFGMTGAVGILLVLLWFATDHAAAAYNYNLLWALPSHALVAMLPSRRLGTLKYYWGAVTGVGLMLLVCWPWLPQQLNVALIPLTLLIVVRSGLQWWSVSRAMQQ
jgi:hypothetical protein